MRFIGDHIGPYESNDLILIPSDMPHTWASREAIDPSAPHQAVVLWFTSQWALQIAELCPEYAPISRLLKRSAGALSFGLSQAELMLDKKPALLSDSPSTRLHAALSLLTELGDSEGASLVTALKARRLPSDDLTPLNRVVDLLHKRYAEPIHVEEMCAVGNMSPRTLHRAFINHIGENVSDYLRKLRIGHACMLLVETDMPISVIAPQAGFFSMSNFNRSFLETRQMTPMSFRRFVRQQSRLPKSFASIDNLDIETSFILKRDKARKIKE